MSDIGQKEYLELKMEQSEARKKKSAEIQSSYIRYMESKSDADFQNLLLLLDGLCVSWVRKQLWRAGCYSDENEHTALQEAREAVWKTIVKDSEEAEKRENFAYYAFGIYKKKALDVVRRVSRVRARMEVVSTEEQVGNTETTVGDLIASAEDDSAEGEKRRGVFIKLFHTYCEAFLNAKAFPPRSLALCYARVFPHLLDEIPDTKAASAKWAFEKMRDQSVGRLKSESENTLQEKVDSGLKWGEEFVGQLNEEIDAAGQKILLRDVIYTGVYNKDKIEDWADYMHKATIKAAARLVCADKELLEIAKDYVSQKDVLYSLVKGGKSDETFER